jgi:hypothetical protein
MCTNDIKANPRGLQNPSQSDMNYKEVRITSKDGVKLYGWFIYHEEDPVESQKRPTIIYFHENAGSKKYYSPL